MAAYFDRDEFEVLATRAREVEEREFEPEEIDSQAEAVSDEADGYLRKGGYIVPLAPQYVGRALKRHLCNYAYANLMDIVGRSAEGDDSLIDKNRDACIAYLKMLSLREVILDAPLAPIPVVPPAPVDDASDPLADMGPVLYSEPPRGF